MANEVEEGQDYQRKAKQIVWQYVLNQQNKSEPIPEFSVYVVWFSKTLQNWKALISTTLPGQMYYEVTYNGNDKETYLDAYKKIQNLCVADKDLAWVTTDVLPPQA